MKKFFTYLDLYKNYPHKKVDYEKYANKMKPSYYAKKGLHSSHKYAITYDEYKKILFTYLDELLEYLLEGNVYEVPYKMGKMYFKKYKGAKVIDYYNTNKKYGKYNHNKPRTEWKYVYHKNLHSNRSMARFHWTAHSNSKYYPNRRLWKYRLSRTAKKLVNERLTNDVNQIYKISE